MKILKRGSKKVLFNVGGDALVSLVGINMTLFDLREAELGKADLSGADLNEAFLDRANLSEAKLDDAKLWRSSLVQTSLVKASLRGAVLSSAIMRDTDLSCADLSHANLNNVKFDRAKLHGATLTGAKLLGADFIDTNLAEANLSAIRDDFFAILALATPEISALRAKLVEGKVDGKIYFGDCCCLIGTIANIRGCRFTEVEGLKPDEDRPAEVWATAIEPGMNEDNQIVKITIGWIDEFVEQMTRNAVRDLTQQAQELDMGY